MPCEWPQRIGPVSYTHLDVYKRQILADRKLLLGVIKKEILVISEKYGDDRRTQIGRCV